VKTVGVIIRPQFPAGEDAARQLLAFLERNGLVVRMPPYLAEALGRSELSCELHDMRVDVAVTVGGDGTVLFASHHLPPRVPLLPVSLKSFGFLAECDTDGMLATLEKVIHGDFEVREALRLSASTQNERFPDATNEVSLFPHELGRPPSIQIRMHESPPLECRADGVIIATPIGSTAHALSVNGPVLDPRLDAILIVASAPLRNSFIPLVVPGSTQIQVQMNKPANLIMDGDQLASLPADTPVTVRKAKAPLRILRRGSSFYSRLQGKLLGCSP
jgi:NAD+ kinase